MEGKYATLNEPYLGYTRIQILEYWPTMYKCEVVICESGKNLFVYDDEFTLD